MKRFLLAALLALGVSACGEEPDCSAFDFAPSAAVLTLRGPDGEKICDLSDACGDETSSCLSIRNTEYDSDSDVPDPEQRKSGYNASLAIAEFAELCEYRVGAWYDRESGLPVRAEISFSGEDINYVSDEISFELEEDACGEPSARSKTVRLQEAESSRE